MQLILEPDSPTKIKMSTLEGETFSEKSYNGISEELSEEVTNGNKENILLNKIRNNGESKDAKDTVVEKDKVDEDKEIPVVESANEEDLELEVQLQISNQNNEESSGSEVDNESKLSNIRNRVDNRPSLNDVDTDDEPKTAKSNYTELQDKIDNAVEINEINASEDTPEKTVSDISDVDSADVQITCDISKQKPIKDPEESEIVQSSEEVSVVKQHSEDLISDIDERQNDVVNETRNEEVHNCNSEEKNEPTEDLERRKLLKSEEELESTEIVSDEEITNLCSEDQSQSLESTNVLEPNTNTESIEEDDSSNTATNSYENKSKETSESEVVELEKDDDECEIIKLVENGDTNIENIDEQSSDTDKKLHKIESKETTRNEIMELDNDDNEEDITKPVENIDDVNSETNIVDEKSSDIDTKLHKIESKETTEDEIMELDNEDNEDDITKPVEDIDDVNSETNIVDEKSSDTDTKLHKIESKETTEDEIMELDNDDNEEDITKSDENIDDVNSETNINQAAEQPLKTNLDNISPINKDISMDVSGEKNDIDKEDDKVEIVEPPQNVIDLELSEPKVDDVCNNVPETETTTEEPEERKKESALKPITLSNNLDFLSDDEDEEPPKTASKIEPDTKSSNVTDAGKQCINLDEDDDIMLIDDIENVTKKSKTDADKPDALKIEDDVKDKSSEETETSQETPEVDAVKEQDYSMNEASDAIAQDNEKNDMEHEKKMQPPKNLIPENYVLSCKKNLADMTRDDLEEFCVMKIVESIVDRINLNDFKTKQKAMAQNLEEYEKKTKSLTKQLRDLQVVLKSVQEEQKKVKNAPVTPLKITRSVGMQVLMTDRPNPRRKPGPGPNNMTSTPGNIKQTRSTTAQNLRPQKGSPQQIPVPRLVPAANAINKNSNSIQSPGNSNKNVPLQNGVKNSPPTQRTAEKRSHSRSQSITVDLTSDEPPSKIASRNVTPPVRLVSPQNLLAPRQQSPQGGQPANPRKVYIPIGGQANQVRQPGQTIMLKTIPQGPGVRPRGPGQMVRMQGNMSVRKMPGLRHPAPLPDAMKQYQPPNWKALPPAPDLKLSKVENGIVISWKIDGYLENSYEEIASYQLYAYQETACPPSTALWKKIGDVKALPLPMACTLTQFMAGFKYYFAVRAVDVRSRLGPFSLPGSILLLNKL